MTHRNARPTRPADARALLSALEAPEGAPPAHLRDLAARLVAEVEARQARQPKPPTTGKAKQAQGGLADRAASAVSRALRAAGMSGDPAPRDRTPQEGGRTVRGPIARSDPEGEGFARLLAKEPEADRPRRAIFNAPAPSAPPAPKPAPAAGSVPKPAHHRAAEQAPAAIAEPVPSERRTGRLQLDLPEPISPRPARADLRPPVLSRTEITALAQSVEARSGLIGEHPSVVALALSGRKTLDQAAALRRLPRAEQRAVHRALRQIARG